MNCPQTLDELLLGSPTVFCGFSGSLVSGLSDGQFLGLDQLRFPWDWKPFNTQALGIYIIYQLEVGNQ
jgi:hypothetical protein